MDMDAELLMLAGEDDAGDAKPSSPAAHAVSSSPTHPASPKKRTRPAPKRAPRKKARRHDSVDDEPSNDSLSELESGEASESEPDARLELETSDDDEEDDAAPLAYPLEGKYKDHADKQQLLAMTEVEREEILAERQAEMDRLQQDRHLRNLLKQKEKDNGVVVSTRTSARVKSKPKSNAQAIRGGKLDEIKRDREERKRNKVGPSSRGDGNEDSGRRRSLLSDDDEEGDKIRSAEERKEEREITLQDMNRLKIGRKDFAKLCDYPRFEECTQDCFVRISLFDRETSRNAYRIAQIVGYKTGKPYELLDGARRTDQYVRVVHGSAERAFPMDYCSNSPFLEAEFNRFKATLAVEKIALPPLSLLRRKAQELFNLNNRKFSDAEMDEMIKKRNANRTGGVQSVLRRARLRTLREQAIADGDDDLVLKIEKEIQEIDDQAGVSRARAETQMERIARINAENRKKNILEIRAAEREEKRRAREEARRAVLTGEMANPFARVKTQPKFHHDAQAGKITPPAPGGANGNKTENGTTANGVGVIGGANDVLASTQQKMKRRKGGVDDVIASLDIGLEIEI